MIVADEIDELPGYGVTLIFTPIDGADSDCRAMITRSFTAFDTDLPELPQDLAALRLVIVVCFAPFHHGTRSRSGSGQASVTSLLRRRRKDRRRRYGITGTGGAVVTLTSQPRTHTPLGWPETPAHAPSFHSILRGSSRAARCWRSHPMTRSIIRLVHALDATRRRAARSPSRCPARLFACKFRPASIGSWWRTSGSGQGDARSLRLRRLALR